MQVVSFSSLTTDLDTLVTDNLTFASDQQAMVSSTTQLSPRSTAAMSLSGAVLVGSWSYGLAVFDIANAAVENSGTYVCIADAAGLHLYNYTLLAYSVSIGQ